jgi:hypothetical protein
VNGESFGFLANFVLQYMPVKFYSSVVLSRFGLLGSSLLVDPSVNGIDIL